LLEESRLKIDVHASHSQDGNQHNSRSYGHVQVPYQEERQKSKGEVADNGDGAVKERQADDDIDWYAVAILVLVPEEADGPALEKSDEEEDEAAEDVEAHDGVDDPFVDGLGGDAEEE
jgi:hypothetical protein